MHLAAVGRYEREAAIAHIEDDLVMRLDDLVMRLDDLVMRLDDMISVRDEWMRGMHM